MMKSGEQESSALEVETGEPSGGAHNHEQARRSRKGKEPIMEAPLIGKGIPRSSNATINKRGGGLGLGSVMNRGIAIIDFVIRLFVLAALLTATAAMGTTEQTLPFFTQFFQFQAKYYDLPTFTYFVIANGITCAYLVLSLAFSIVTIMRPLAKAPRLLLITFDTIAMTLSASAASAAAAIVYLAHKGNTNTNWIAICQQFDSFCQRTSGAVVASFISVLLLIFLVILSIVALKNH